MIGITTSYYAVTESYTSELSIRSFTWNRTHHPWNDSPSLTDLTELTELSGLDQQCSK